LTIKCEWNVLSLFEKPKDINFEFDPDPGPLRRSAIKEWSYGRSEKAGDDQLRSFKPERDGLFCAKIFGPIKDWECLCGKYKRMKHRGIVCDKCGVEVIQSKVRAERMGTSNWRRRWPISVPEGPASRIGTLLDMTLRQLEKVLYFESFVVLDPGDTPLKVKELLTEERYRKAQIEYGPGSFKAGMGAEIIREMLRALDLGPRVRGDPQEDRDRYVHGNQEEAHESGSRSSSRSASPQQPRLDDPGRGPGHSAGAPSPRALEGGRFATSDLNDLYRPVINRTTGFRRLEELKAPSVIIRNEKRMAPGGG